MQSTADPKKLRRQAYGLGVIALIAAGLGAFLVASGALPTQYNLEPGKAVPDITVPDGFEITVLTDNLAAPRGIVAHPSADVIFVAERGAGRVIALQDQDENQIADEIIVVADELNAPSGLAFHDNWLYIAEADQVTRVKLNENFQAENQEVIIQGLPVGRNTSEAESNLHALLIKDDELYVSIGASCAACEESDSRLATVMVYNLDGSNERVFSRGLYRVLGMAVNPVTNELWVTNQGRPQTDDPAPETIYRLQNGDDAGWPRCIAGDIIDPDGGSPGACGGGGQPLITLEPQSNITGMIFYDHPNAPDAFRGDLLVVLHGGVVEKGREGEQIGFTILHLDIDPQTGTINTQQTPEPFVDGFWLSPEPGDHLGRPYDLTLAPDGSLYITDDAAGAVYHLYYTNPLT